MSDSKPLASLSATMLARKGGAKPAMRPQFAPLDSRMHDLDSDLGWNDMGHGGEPHGAEVVQLVPEVVRQQQAIARRVNGAAPRARRSALAEGRRAAFTLRVDSDRHLKLRLACTVANRSAQQLVLDALDRLLDDMPEIADLAAQVATKR